VGPVEEIQPTIGVVVRVFCRMNQSGAHSCCNIALYSIARQMMVEDMRKVPRLAYERVLVGAHGADATSPPPSFPLA
jgi:hypothetical protein